MGIYDRDYYRREGPSFLGSFANRGQVCKILIAINIVVFIIQQVTIQWVPLEQPGDFEDRPSMAMPQQPFTDALMLDTNKVLEGQVWRLVTCGFLHGSIMHILFNMLFLWWFGSDVEDLYGPREFLAFYLFGIVLSSVAFVLCDFALDPARRVPALGASGAVTAVMVLCALHYPMRTILLFWFLPVPIWLFVVFNVGRDLMGLLTNAPGVAWSAHLGGAAFAFLYYKAQWRITSFLPAWGTIKARRARPKLRVYREEEAPAPPVSVGAPAVSGGRDVDEQLEAKLDAVLEKVARHGQSSLTDTEREILFRASEIYKKRRR